MAEVETAPSGLGEEASHTALVPSDPAAQPSETAVTVSSDGKKKIKKLVKKKRRPARPQVDPATFKGEPPPQTGTIFNIWYNKRPLLRGPGQRLHARGPHPGLILLPVLRARAVSPRAGLRVPAPAAECTHRKGRRAGRHLSVQRRLLWARQVLRLPR